MKPGRLPVERGSDKRTDDYNLCNACLKNGSCKEPTSEPITKSGAIAKYTSHFFDLYSLSQKAFFARNPEALRQIVRIEIAAKSDNKTIDGAGRMVWHVPCSGFSH